MITTSFIPEWGFQLTNNFISLSRCNKASGQVYKHHFIDGETEDHKEKVIFLLPQLVRATGGQFTHVLCLQALACLLCQIPQEGQAWAGAGASSPPSPQTRADPKLLSRI